MHGLGQKISRPELNCINFKLCRFDIQHVDSIEEAKLQSFQVLNSFSFNLIFDLHLLMSQLESALMILLAEEGLNLLASHRNTMLVQSLIRLDFSGKIREPLNLVTFLCLAAKVSAAADIAFWQTWLQHSIVGSIFSQATSKADVFKLFSISLTSITGQEDSVRLEGSTEQISRSFSLAP